MTCFQVNIATNQMLKVIIIDDELNAREILKELLAKNCTQAELIGEADSVESGVQLLNELTPDLVLLDINLSDGTGFDLLRQIDNIRFKIIFVTAYDKYALNAIKFSALDYLLKPVDQDDFVLSMNRAVQAIENESLSLKLNAFFNNFKHMATEARKIVLHTTTSVYLMNVQDVVRLQAENNQCKVYMNSGESIFVSKSMKEFDDMLSEYNFARVHKTHMVNLMYAERFDKANKNLLIMKDKSVVPVAVRRKEELLERISRL